MDAAASVSVLFADAFPGGWGGIALLVSRALLFCLPFAVLGHFLEKDVGRVKVGHRILKILVLLFFLMPLSAFALLNFLGPILPSSVRSATPLVELFWVMENRWAAFLLLVLSGVFMILHLAEAWKGDLQK